MIPILLKQYEFENKNDICNYVELSVTYFSFLNR